MKVYAIVGNYHGNLESCVVTCDFDQVETLKQKMTEYFGEDEECEVGVIEITTHNNYDAKAKIWED